MHPVQLRPLHEGSRARLSAAVLVQAVLSCVATTESRIGASCLAVVCSDLDATVLKHPEHMKLCELPRVRVSTSCVMRSLFVRRPHGHSHSESGREARPLALAYGGAQGKRERAAEARIGVEQPVEVFP